MNIAIVGSGISGLTAAHLLHKKHQVTVFEADSRLGGHTHTHDWTTASGTWKIDSGFIVCNDWTYPHFLALMKRIGVELRATNMTFSVASQSSGIEWGGKDVDTLFCQRRNFFRPSFLRMVREIFRFNAQGIALAEDGGEGEEPLGFWLDRHGYSRFFQEHYVLPMGGAIWSTSSEKMRQFPTKFFVRFFKNHGMLSVNDRPTWRTVVGGSSAYLKPLTNGFQDRIRLSSPVRSVRRLESGRVDVSIQGQGTEVFDAVVLSCHADQALEMIVDPSAQERKVLTALPYQENTAILHNDTSILPRHRKAWSAWNFHVLGDGRDQEKVAVTYWMNELQGLDAPETFLVTLNHEDGIDPAKIFKRIRYHHPFYTPEGTAAQQAKHTIQGVDNIWFAGAYWSWGFHEDGCKSGVEVATALGGESL